MFMGQKYYKNSKDKPAELISTVAFIAFANGLN